MRFHRNTFIGQLMTTEYQSPVGILNVVCSAKGVRAILWEEDLRDAKSRRALSSLSKGINKHADAAAIQLDQYFHGELKKFDLELDPVGTNFQIQAWKQLSLIPFGKTFSYSQQAEKLGSTKLARAVGGANRKNPISIVVPCHRVIGKSGDLTGFAGGLQMKEYLLKHEGVFAS